MLLPNTELLAKATFKSLDRDREKEEEHIKDHLNGEM